MVIDHRSPEHTGVTVINGEIRNPKKVEGVHHFAYAFAAIK